MEVGGVAETLSQTWRPLNLLPAAETPHSKMNWEALNKNFVPSDSSERKPIPLYVRPRGHDSTTTLPFPSRHIAFHGVSEADRELLVDHVTMTQGVVEDAIGILEEDECLGLDTSDPSFSAKRKKVVEILTSQPKQVRRKRVRTQYPQALSTSMVARDEWMKELASSRPLDELCQYIPNGFKGSAILDALWRYSVPPLRGIWFIKVTTLNNKGVNHQHVRSREWTDIFRDYMRKMVEEVFPTGHSSSTATSRHLKLSFDERMSKWLYMETVMEMMAADHLLLFSGVVDWLYERLQSVVEGMEAKSSLFAVHFSRLSLLLPFLFRHLDEVCSLRKQAERLFSICTSLLARLKRGLKRNSSPTTPVNDEPGEGIATQIEEAIQSLSVVSTHIVASIPGLELTGKQFGTHLQPASQSRPLNLAILDSASVLKQHEEKKSNESSALQDENQGLSIEDLPVFSFESCRLQSGADADEIRRFHRPSQSTSVAKSAASEGTCWRIGPGLPHYLLSHVVDILDEAAMQLQGDRSRHPSQGRVLSHDSSPVDTSHTSGSLLFDAFLLLDHDTFRNEAHVLGVNASALLLAVEWSSQGVRAESLPCQLIMNQIIVACRQRIETELHLRGLVPEASSILGDEPPLHSHLMRFLTRFTPRSMTELTAVTRTYSTFINEGLFSHSAFLRATIKDGLVTPNTSVASAEEVFEALSSEASIEGDSKVSPKASQRKGRRASTRRKKTRATATSGEDYDESQQLHETTGEGGNANAAAILEQKRRNLRFRYYLENFPMVESSKSERAQRRISLYSVSGVSFDARLSKLAFYECIRFLSDESGGAFLRKAMAKTSKFDAWTPEDRSRFGHLFAVASDVKNLSFVRLLDAVPFYYAQKVLDWVCEKLSSLLESFSDSIDSVDTAPSMTLRIERVIHEVFLAMEAHHRYEEIIDTVFSLLRSSVGLEICCFAFLRRLFPVVVCTKRTHELRTLCTSVMRKLGNESARRWIHDAELPESISKQIQNDVFTQWVTSSMGPKSVKRGSTKGPSTTEMISKLRDLLVNSFSRLSTIAASGAGTGGIDVSMVKHKKEQSAMDVEPSGSSSSEIGSDRFGHVASTAAVVDELVMLIDRLPANTVALEGVLSALFETVLHVSVYEGGPPRFVLASFQSIAYTYRYANRLLHSVKSQKSETVGSTFISKMTDLLLELYKAADLSGSNKVEGGVLEKFGFSTFKLDTSRPLRSMKETAECILTALMFCTQYSSEGASKVFEACLKHLTKDGPVSAPEASEQDDSESPSLRSSHWTCFSPLLSFLVSPGDLAMESRVFPSSLASWASFELDSQNETLKHGVIRLASDVILSMEDGDPLLPSVARSTVLRRLCFHLHTSLLASEEGPVFTDAGKGGPFLLRLFPDLIPAALKNSPESIVDLVELAHQVDPVSWSAAWPLIASPLSKFQESDQGAPQLVSDTLLSLVSMRSNQTVFTTKAGKGKTKSTRMDVKVSNADDGDVANRSAGISVGVGLSLIRALGPQASSTVISRISDDLSHECDGLLQRAEAARVYLQSQQYIPPDDIAPSPSSPQSPFVPQTPQGDSFEPSMTDSSTFFAGIEGVIEVYTKLVVHGDEELGKKKTSTKKGANSGTEHEKTGLVSLVNSPLIIQALSLGTALPVDAKKHFTCSLIEQMERLYQVCIKSRSFMVMSPGVLSCFQRAVLRRLRCLSHLLDSIVDESSASSSSIGSSTTKGEQLLSLLLKLLCCPVFQYRGWTDGRLSFFDETLSVFQSMFISISKSQLSLGRRIQVNIDQFLYRAFRKVREHNTQLYGSHSVVSKEHMQRITQAISFSEEPVMLSLPASLSVSRSMGPSSSSSSMVTTSTASGSSSQDTSSTIDPWTVLESVSSTRLVDVIVANSSAV